MWMSLRGSSHTSCGMTEGGDSDVLVIIHGCPEVVIFHVETQVASAVFGVGDGAVDVYFCIEH